MYKPPTMYVYSLRETLQLENTTSLTSIFSTSACTITNPTPITITTLAMLYKQCIVTL